MSITIHLESVRYPDAVHGGTLSPAQHGRRRDALGRAALWREPAAFHPNDDTERAAWPGSELPPSLPLASVLASLPETEPTT